MVALPLETERHEPLPHDPLGQRLCLTFPYRWQPIVGVNESDPTWQTVKPYPLRPRVLWRLWQDPAQLVGVRFDHQTRYALIDIDHESPYHPAQDATVLGTIRAALETIGLYRSVLIRSSWSGGLHLYLPLPEAVPTFALASTLRQCLEAQGLAIAQGQLEIFPNCKAYAVKGSYSEYNAHRLPLQPYSGSYLLDADANPVSQDLGRFFEQWDVAAASQDLGELREAIATARHNRQGKRRRPATVVEEWLQDLRTEMEEGWTGYGQTNHLLKTIACYGVVFEGLTGDALTEFIHQTAIEAPGYFQWCRHQHEIHLKAAVWARSAEGYYWRLGDDRQRRGTLHGSEPPAPSMNELRSNDAQHRIRQVVRELEQQGMLPATPTARARMIANQGAISLKTLYRYPSLWHPDHYASPVEERSSKTVEPEPDTPIASEGAETGERSPGLSEDGKFYTSEKIMKGSPSEIGLGAILLSSSPRRLPVSDQTAPGTSTAALEALPRAELQVPRMVQLSFPQVDEMDPLERSRVEADCVAAMVRGDRPGVMGRLFTLWREGYGDLVRSLCQWHPEWGLTVNQMGVVEVGHGASDR